MEHPQIKVEIGKIFPREIPDREALFLSIQPEGLNLLVRMNNVKKLGGYGLHISEEFPYGLMIWIFEPNENMQMTPFNIKHAEFPDEDVADFLSLPKEKTMLTQVLINETGIVDDIIHDYLFPEYVNALQTLWSDSSLDWSEYDSKYEKIHKNPSKIVSPENTKFYFLENVLGQKP